MHPVPWRLLLGGGLALAAAAALPATLPLAGRGPWPVMAIWAAAFVVAVAAHRHAPGAAWAAAWAAAGLALPAIWAVRVALAGRPPLAALGDAAARGGWALVAVSLALALLPRSARGQPGAPAA